MIRRCLLAMAVSLGLLFSGCKGVPVAAEKKARQHRDAVAGVYRPQGQRPNLSLLTPESGLGDILRFAMLNQPRVEAAYYEWVQSVERITVERSLPDPRLTFESDITTLIETVMPGLMMEFPGPGKLKARAAVASAESEGRYFAFETSLLRAAGDVKKAYYQLRLLSEKIRITRKTLELLGDIENVALKQNEVGKAAMQDVLRAQIEQDRMRTELTNLEDARLSLAAQYKAALGLGPAEANPPLPVRFDVALLDSGAHDWLAEGLARNPRLKAMEAVVRQADAAIRLAAKSRVPDFSAGIQADAKASPVMVRPSLGMTLPIWRDKIAAEIASAQAGRRAAQARLSDEQIALAVEFAGQSYLFREAVRNMELLQLSVLPKARQALEAARSSYLSGRTEFFNLMDAWRMLLGFELSQAEEESQRELAMAELSLAIAGIPPAQGPLLPDAGGIEAIPPKNKE